MREEMRATLLQATIAVAAPAFTTTTLALTTAPALTITVAAAIAAEGIHGSAH